MRQSVGRWVSCLLTFLFAMVIFLEARAEIPYRYSLQEGFILVVDDSGKRALKRSNPIAGRILEALAGYLESDRFRIPVEYGKTLAWHTGTLLEEGTSREEMRRIFNDARALDPSRAHPANILFLRVIARQNGLKISADWVDLVRGENIRRFTSDLLPFEPLSKDMAALTLFFDATGAGMLEALGPAPPRGYGDVPPAWLIRPISYTITMQNLSEDFQGDIYDALTIDIPYYIADHVIRQTKDRLDLIYETEMPSWKLAQEISSLMEALDRPVEIIPKKLGLKITGPSLNGTEQLGRHGNQ